MPRIAGAEIGWTPDQWLHVMDRLTAAGLALYDRERMFVWVKVWWEHHRASQVMGPKLRRTTLVELRRLPEPWLASYLSEFRTQLEDEEHINALDQAAVEGPVPEDDVTPIPYRYGIDMVSNPARPNSNYKANSSIKVTPTLHEPPLGAVDNSAIPMEYRAAVEAGIAKAQQTGTAKAGPQAVRDEVAKRYQSGRPPRDAAAYAFHLAGNMSEPKQEFRPSDPSVQELESWARRCFCWPTENPTDFIQITDGGLVERCFLDGEKWRRGYEPLCRSVFLPALREKELQEIDPCKFEHVKQLAA